MELGGITVFHSDHPAPPPFPMLLVLLPPSDTHSLYSCVPPPPQLASASAIGPLRLADVPLSAIDFHVSDVVPKLLALPGVRAAAAKLRSSSGGGGAGSSLPAGGGSEVALKSAMWLFRSSLNGRKWLPLISPAAGGKAQKHSTAAVGSSSSAPSSLATQGSTCPPGCWDCSGNAQRSRELLLGSLSDEEADKRGLRELWAEAEAEADSFSRLYIRGRFQH